MFGSNVAPPRIVREKPESWTCKCVVSRHRSVYGATRIEVLKPNPGYLTRCPDCGTKRP